MGPDGTTSFSAQCPAVAYNRVHQEYLVIWRGNDNTGTRVQDGVEIFGRRLNAATGDAVGVNDFRLSDLGYEEVVAPWPNWMRLG
jgi:hypothetical protein